MKKRTFSKSFDNIFWFLFRSYQTGVLVFCGQSLDHIRFKQGAPCAKECFKNFENGMFRRQTVIYTRHPRILTAVIAAKKSWGLHVDEWSAGIAECSFLREEILELFAPLGIEMPIGFAKEFETAIRRKQYKFIRSNEHD